MFQAYLVSIMTDVPFIIGPPPYIIILDQDNTQVHDIFETVKNW